MIYPQEAISKWCLLPKSNLTSVQQKQWEHARRKSARTIPTLNRLSFLCSRASAKAPQRPLKLEECKTPAVFSQPTILLSLLWTLTASLLLMLGTTSRPSCPRWPNLISFTCGKVTLSTESKTGTTSRSSPKFPLSLATPFTLCSHLS